MPENFFSKSPLGIPIVPPPLSNRLRFRRFLKIQRLFLGKLHEYFTARLRITTAALATEARLIPPREAAGMGLDPEKMRAMLELSEKLVREKDGEEFAEAARHLFNIVKDAIAKLTGGYHRHRRINDHSRLPDVSWPILGCHDCLDVARNSS